MRIGVTQRVEYIDAYAETRDCIDHRWSSMLEILQMTMVPIPNNLKDIERWLGEMQCDAFILTGGNDLAYMPEAKNVSKKRDKTEIALLKHAKKFELPVLGVCRGFQLINAFFGGKLEQIPGHVATRHPVRFLIADSQKQPEEVNSFHDWGISTDGLASHLIPCALDDGDYVESARHKKLDWLGIMWHPEREEIPQEHDLETIRDLFNKEIR